MSEYKFPTEVIDLPSAGKVYPKDSPLSSGKLELKYKKIFMMAILKRIPQEKEKNMMGLLLEK